MVFRFVNTLFLCDI